MNHRAILPFVLTVAMTVCLIPRVNSAPETQFDSALKNLPWRNIGPAIMGGRIDDIEAVEGKPDIVYVATATGGLFKSTNHGTTWESLFDSQPSLTIGDVAISRSNPDIVWAGTGESNNRQSSSWGDGVYKSTDGGKSWTNMGLQDTHHIARIVIHPTNPDTVYVAATGHLWGANSERGVYKTEDGGKTWTLSLHVNEDTGATDIAIDPSNPEVVFAAVYQRRRTNFGFVGGGPGSAICKSSDGGKTWRKLTEGLPTGDTGRIGIDVSRSNPKVVCAVIENAKGGIFRSEDSGETWKKMSDFNSRPMYYSQLRIDPTDDKRLYLAALAVSTSDDGGKTWASLSMNSIHSDFHAFWIDPANPTHLIAGCDGGLQWSYDRGRTWDFVNTIPLGQFYEVAFDFRKPYYVYGGLQDNGSWGGPSATLTTTGPTNEDWFRVGGGDGFYCAVDPTDWTCVYSESQQGFLQRTNILTNEGRRIRPTPPAGEPPYRFDWNSPIVISSHNPKKLYFGGNRLFISEDRGDHWRRTEDLSTKPDRTKMAIMGSVPNRQTLSLHDGQSSFGQIVTITESPLAAGLLYVGTDDGCLHISKDDGRTFKDICPNVQGLPKGTYVVRLQASRFHEGRVYAAFDNHRRDDFKPYIYVSEDYGESWRPISTGIPEGSVLHVIREHPRNQNLLLAGTERGAYISFDRGQSWRQFPAPLPAFRVDDIQIHPRDNDLILATHARGIWILDDVTGLEKLADAATNGGAGNIKLFEPRPAVDYRVAFRKGSVGNKFYVAPNPPRGAIIQYYLAKEPEAGQDVRLAILDPKDKSVLSELTVIPHNAGLNRVTWSMRLTSLARARAQNAGGQGGGGRRANGQAGQLGADGAQATQGQPVGQGQPGSGGRRRGGGGERLVAGTAGTQTPPAASGAGVAGGGQGQAGGRGGGGFGGFGPQGPRALPGQYLVRLTVGSEVQTVPLTVEEDPRITLKPAQRRAHFDATVRLYKLQLAFAEASRGVESLRTQLADRQKEDALKQAPQLLKDAIAAIDKRMKDLQAVTAQPRRGGGGAGLLPQEEALGGEPAVTQRPLSIRLTSAIDFLDSVTEPPSDVTRKENDAITGEVLKLIKDLNDLDDKDLAELNKQLEAAKLQPIKPAAKIKPPK